MDWNGWRDRACPRLGLALVVVATTACIWAWVIRHGRPPREDEDVVLENLRTVMGLGWAMAFAAGAAAGWLGAWASDP